MLRRWFARPFAQSRNKNGSDCREARLGVEALDKRLALAGNVVASLSGTTLTITGDDLDNHVTVFRSATGIQVGGQSGTNITLKANTPGAVSQSFAVADVSKLSIRIYGKGGADKVSLFALDSNPLTIKSLTVDLGAGADNLSITQTRLMQTGTNAITLGTASQTDNDQVEINGLQVHGNLSVALGGGSDYFESNFGFNVGGKFSLDTSSGDDTAYVDAGTYGSLDVRLGEGNDNVRLGYNTTASNYMRVIGAASVDGGNGTNGVSFLYMDFDSTVSVKGGTGRDVVTFESTFTAAGKLTANLGSGDDLVQIDGNGSVSGAVDVFLGEGNNEFLVESLSVGAGFKYNGGAGNDVLDIEDGMLVTGAISITAGNGANQLTLDAQATGAFTYSGGTGIDTLNLGVFYIGTAATFSTGAGDDAIRLDDFRAGGNAVFNTSTGNDLVEIDGLGSVIGVFDAQLGEGHNTLTVETLSAAGGFKYTSGAGVDYITIEDGLLTKTVTVKTGAGNDVINVDGIAKTVLLANVDKIDLDTGAGDDLVVVSYVFATDVRVKLGAGYDELSATSMVISTFAQIEGGSELDFGYFSGSFPSLPSKLKVTGFESGNLSPI